MSAVSDYDDERRNEAKKAGQPQARMLYPAVGRRYGSALVMWLRGDILHGVLANFGEDGDFYLQRNDPYLVGASLLLDAANGPSEVAFAFGDSRAMKAALGILKAEKTRDADDLIKKIQHGCRLATGGFVVVLTQTLARKFWLPAGMQTSKITDWRDAFGLKAEPLSLVKMLSKTYKGELMVTNTGAPVTQAFAALERLDTKAIGMIVHRGTTAAVEAFEATEKIADLWGAIERMDPLLRHRAILEGTVVRFTPIRRESGSAAVVGLSTQPCKLREAGVVAMPDSNEATLLGKAKVNSISFDEGAGGLMVHLVPDTVHGSARASRSGIQSFRAIDRAMIEKRSLLLTGTPFVSVRFKSGRGMNRWTRKPSPENRVQQTDVPLDVILAGGVN